VLVRLREEVQEVPRAVTLVLVALLGCQPIANAPSSPTVAVGTPSATPATTAPQTPSPTAEVLDGRFGLVVLADRRGDASVDGVRSETSDAVVTSFMSQDRSWTFLSRTVAPDGRSIAYWSPVNAGAALHVRSVTTGADQTVFTAGPDMSGNTFAWSSDGTGLVVAIDNNCQEICGVQGGRSIAELWTVDLASGAAEKIASGSFWLPVVWDRAAKRVAAGVTGPGGYLIGYHVIDLSRQPYAVRGIGFEPPVIGRLEASSDARFVSLTVITGIATLSWWPLAEPEKRADVTFDGTAAAAWRPGTSEIWWAGGLDPRGCRTSPCASTELSGVDVVTGARRSLRGTFGSALAGFRIDGSAAMTVDRSGGPESLIAVDVRTGQTARLSPGGPFVRLR
jgi:hypothetical protein